MKYLKYTQQQLQDAAENSTSVSEVVRKLRGENKSGSFNTHIKSRLLYFNIDISHFLGQAYLRGKTSNRKRSFTDILTYGRVEHGAVLKRALLESGVPYKCNECDLLGVWNNKPITLQVDHIVGNRQDNRPVNLRFMCPNCHSQTVNYGGRGSKKKI